MSTCVSCSEPRRIVYRGMCQECTRDFRYTRYRGWIERRAMRTGKAIPREGTRFTLRAELKAVSA